MSLLSIRKMQKGLSLTIFVHGHFQKRYFCHSESVWMMYVRINMITI